MVAGAKQLFELASAHWFIDSFHVKPDVAGISSRCSRQAFAGFDRPQQVSRSAISVYGLQLKFGPL